MYTRNHSAAVNNNAVTPIGLPQNFYNPVWLESLNSTTHLHLRVKNVDYDFSLVLTNTPSSVTVNSPRNIASGSPYQCHEASFNGHPPPIPLDTSHPLHSHSLYASNEPLAVPPRSSLSHFTNLSTNYAMHSRDQDLIDMHCLGQASSSSHGDASIWPNGLRPSNSHHQTPLGIWSHQDEGPTVWGSNPHSARVSFNEYEDFSHNIDMIRLDGSS